MRIAATPRGGRPRKFTCPACFGAPKSCEACAARRREDRLAYGRAYQRSNYHDVIKKSPEKLEAHRRSSRDNAAKRRQARGCQPRVEKR